MSTELLEDKQWVNDAEHPSTIAMDVPSPPQARREPMARAHAHAPKTGVNTFLFEFHWIHMRVGFYLNWKLYALLGTKEKSKKKLGGRPKQLGRRRRKKEI